MKRLFSAIATLVLLAGTTMVPAQAAPTTKLKNNFRVTGNLTVDGTTTQTGAVTFTGNVTVGGTLGVTGVATFTAKPTLSTATIGASGDTYTIPDVGDASFVMTAGAQTVAGVKTFSSAPVITGGLPAAQIQTGSAKRQVLTARLSPETGAAADSTVYRALLYFGRAGTVTKVTYGTAVDPVSGTNVIAVEKGSFTGNTMLSTATVSLNGTTAFTAVTATLTATGADLALLATEPVALEYNAGTQGTDAEQVTVTVEFEPTDF